MKVLDLACDNRHSFEGWFASEVDFQSQLARDLIECPMCGSSAIHKLLSAPRLNLGVDARAAPVEKAASAPQTAVPAAAPLPHNAAMQAAWLKMMRHVLANTEDVGSGFAEQARRMHYGEVDARGIRGQASRDETEALLEEGIAVLSMPLPPALESPEH